MGSHISPHFTFSEFVTTTHTDVENKPRRPDVRRAEKFSLAVLEPWRSVVGPLEVSSWFRSKALNTKVGGSKTSRHMTGEAADVIPLGLSEWRGDLEPWELRLRAWSVLVDLVGVLWVDQAIIYEHTRHIHVHAVTGPREVPRRMVLVSTGPKTYVPWEGYTGPLSTDYERLRM